MIKNPLVKILVLSFYLSTCLLAEDNVQKANIESAPSSYLRSSISCIVTASDYAEFLNSEAKSDSSFFYDKKMGSDSETACIKRVGEPGSYRYAVIEGKENTAITFINEENAAAYADWSRSETKILSTISCNNCGFEIIPPSLPTLSLAVTSTSSSNVTSYWSEASAIAGIVGVAACHELMMRPGDEMMRPGDEGSENDVSDISDVESIHSCASSRSAASAVTTASMGKREQYPLALVDFTSAALDHPTADRLVIDQEDTGMIVPMKSSMNIGKNTKENKAVALAFKDVLRAEYSRELAGRLIPGQRDSVWDSFSLSSANIFQYINKIEKRITENNIIAAKESDLDVLCSHVERKNIVLKEAQEFYENHQSEFDGKKTVSGKVARVAAGAAEIAGDTTILGVIPVGMVVKGIGAAAGKLEKRPLKVAQKIAEGAKADLDLVQKRLKTLQRKEAKKSGIAQASSTKKGVRFEELPSPPSFDQELKSPTTREEATRTTRARVEDAHEADWIEAERLESLADIAYSKATRNSTPENWEACLEASQQAKQVWNQAAGSREMAAFRVKNEIDKNRWMGDVATAEEKADEWGRVIKEARIRYNEIIETLEAQAAAEKAAAEEACLTGGRKKGGEQQVLEADKAAEIQELQDRLASMETAHQAALAKAKTEQGKAAADPRSLEHISAEKITALLQNDKISRAKTSFTKAKTEWDIFSEKSKTYCSKIKDRIYPNRQDVAASAMRAAEAINDAASLSDDAIKATIMPTVVASFDVIATIAAADIKWSLFSDSKKVGTERRNNSLERASLIRRDIESLNQSLEFAHKVDPEHAAAIAIIFHQEMLWAGSVLKEANHLCRIINQILDPDTFLEIKQVQESGDTQISSHRVELPQHKEKEAGENSSNFDGNNVNNKSSHPFTAASNIVASKSEHESDLLSFFGRSTSFSNFAQQFEATANDYKTKATEAVDAGGYEEANLWTQAATSAEKVAEELYLASQQEGETQAEHIKKAESEKNNVEQLALFATIASFSRLAREANARVFEYRQKAELATNKNHQKEAFYWKQAEEQSQLASDKFNRAFQIGNQSQPEDIAVGNKAQAEVDQYVKLATEEASKIDALLQHSEEAHAKAVEYREKAAEVRRANYETEASHWDQAAEDSSKAAECFSKAILEENESREKEENDAAIAQAAVDKYVQLAEKERQRMSKKIEHRKEKLRADRDLVHDAVTRWNSFLDNWEATPRTGDVGRELMQKEAEVLKASAIFNDINNRIKEGEERVERARQNAPKNIDGSPDKRTSEGKDFLRYSDRLKEAIEKGSSKILLLANEAIVEITQRIKTWLPSIESAMAEVAYRNKNKKLFYSEAGWEKEIIEKANLNAFKSIWPEAIGAENEREIRLNDIEKEIFKDADLAWNEYIDLPEAPEDIKHAAYKKAKKLEEIAQKNYALKIQEEAYQAANTLCTLSAEGVWAVRVYDLASDVKDFNNKCAEATTDEIRGIYPPNTHRYNRPNLQKETKDLIRAAAIAEAHLAAWKEVWPVCNESITPEFIERLISELTQIIENIEEKNRTKR